MAVRVGAPALALWPLVVGGGEGVAQLELEKDVPIDRIVADGLGPADCRGASWRIGNLLRASGHIELALAAFVVFDGTVQGIARIAAKIGRLERRRLHVDGKAASADEERD